MPYFKLKSFWKAIGGYNIYKIYADHYLREYQISLLVGEFGICPNSLK